MGESLSRNGDPILAASSLGRVAMGIDSAGPVPFERAMAVTPAGALVTSAGAASPPGGNITSDADVVVGIGLTVALGVPPATARAMTIQVTSAAGVSVRIREAGGAAGSGVLLFFGGSATFTLAIEQMEAQHVGGGAATVSVQYQNA